MYYKIIIIKQIEESLVIHVYKQLTESIDTGEFMQKTNQEEMDMQKEYSF